jgi:ABC-type uncharacterized transport system involved in gliding motility auxiliary subunit
MTEKPISLSSNLGRFAGAVGAVLLVSTPVTWLLTQEFGPTIWGKILAGVLLVGAYFLTNAGFLSRLAGSRSTGLWVVTAASAALVVGIVGVANFVAKENDIEIDVTREQLHTLSDQTRGVLESLDREVEILAFYESWEQPVHRARETLGRYARASERVTWEVISPQQRPDLTERHGISERGARVVVLSGDNEARARNASESELTHAIVRVAAHSAKTVAFLAGHGEPSIDAAEDPQGLGAFAELIRAEGYEVRNLSMLEAATAGQTPGRIDIRSADAPEPPEEPVPALEVPRDVAVLVVAGATSLLFEPEQAAITRFLETGGRVLLALEPHIEPGMPWLERWNVQVGDDLIVDTNVMNRLLGLGPAAPMVRPVETSPEDETHPLLEDLDEAVVMFTARSLALGGGSGAQVNTVPLLVTGESAWGETAPVDGAAERGHDDHLGPVAVAMAAVRHVPSHMASRRHDQARVVVFGDSDWFTNRYLPMQSNGDLAVNTINWLASEEDRISIGRRARSASVVFFSQAQLTVLKFFALDLLWILYVALGLGIVLVRRQR